MKMQITNLTRMARQMIAGRIAPMILALLALPALASHAAADEIPVWWAAKLAAPGFVALENTLYEDFAEPLILQAFPFDGTRTETAKDCPAAVDGFERGFYQASNHELLIVCRARILAARAREATSSTFRGMAGLPAPLVAADILTLPSLVGPYDGCAETLISLRSDQSWWSLARHHHVYFGPQTDDVADDGREEKFIKPVAFSALGKDSSAHDMHVAATPNGGLAFAFAHRRGEIEPLVWGDLDGNGIEDMIVMARTAGKPARLIIVTRPKAGTIMTLLDPTFHYQRILDKCPKLALQQMAAGCVE